MSIDTSKVTRVEVYDDQGRKYGIYAAESVYTSVQDEGRTLKVIVKGGNSEPNYNWLTGEFYD